MINKLKQPIEFEHQTIRKHLMRKHFLNFGRMFMKKNMLAISFDRAMVLDGTSMNVCPINFNVVSHISVVNN